MLGTWVVGIDLGGTNLKVGLVDAGGAIAAIQTCPTEAQKGPDHFINIVDQLVDALCVQAKVSRSASILGAGLGTPGPLDFRKGIILKAANLPGWVNFPLRDRMAGKLRVPVVIENDANAAAYGEFIGQRPRASQPSMVLLTLGTGVGAGVIIDGKVLHGHFDNAGELGHMIVVPNGLPCPCGQRGCLEAYASAGAIARRFEQAVLAGESSSVPSGSDAKAISIGAHQGDALCRRIWDEACLYLAIACINIQHAFNPEVILLGGGMAEAGEFLLACVRSHFDANRWHLHDDFPRIELARLGSNAGIIGAAALAWEKLASASS